MTKALFLLLVVDPGFLFSGAPLRLPGLHMWSGEEATDQHVIPSCLASVPAAASIRVAAGSRGYVRARHRLPDNAVANWAAYDSLSPRLHRICKLRLIGPVCLYTNPEKDLQWSLAFHCRAYPQIPLPVSGICGKYLGGHGKALGYWRLFRSVPFCRRHVCLPCSCLQSCVLSAETEEHCRGAGLLDGKCVRTSQLH